MTRLQKKCLVAVAGAHLLAVVVVFCSGFFKPTPPQDDTPVLTLIPPTVSDQPNTGVPEPRQPPPTPQPPPPQPQPEPPKQVEQPKPVEPVKQVDPIQPPEKIQPEAEIPVPKPKPPKHEVKVDLTPAVRKKTTETPKNDDEAKKEEQRELLAERKAQQQAQQARVRALENVAHAIKQNSSAAMTVEVQGNSNASRANYGSVVISRYYHAWVAPENMANDSAVVTFSVTIARDGNVISSHITSPSGDANVDNAVRRMLDRVNFIDAFPDDTTDRERTYHIDFNATRTSIQ